MKQMLCFTDEIASHLKKQSNMSQYVSRLILQDMGLGITLEDQVKEILQNMLRSYYAEHSYLSGKWQNGCNYPLT